VHIVNSSQIIHIQPQAARKPALGEPCNGCGVCCLVEPCPLGMALSGRRAGACTALRWQAGTLVYRCGAITDPESVLRQVLPRWLRWLAPALAFLLGRLARRWIAADKGCDSRLELAQEPESDRQSSR
jgi:hypothetical protein